MIYADPKDPNDVDDMSLVWTNLLASGETISTITTTVVTGTVTLGTPSISGATTTVRVSAGTAGTQCEVLFRITTSNSRQLDMTLAIPIASL